MFSCFWIVMGLVGRGMMQEHALLVLVRSFEGLCERRILLSSSDFLR
jgi:hypothetical protein